MQKTVVALSACLVLLLAMAMQSREAAVGSSPLAGIDWMLVDQSPAIPKPASPVSGGTGTPEPPQGVANSAAPVETQPAKDPNTGEAGWPASRVSTVSQETESPEMDPTPATTSPVISVTPQPVTEFRPDETGSLTVRNPFYEIDAAAPRMTASQPPTTQLLVDSVSAQPTSTPRHDSAGDSAGLALSSATPDDQNSRPDSVAGFREFQPVHAASRPAAVGPEFTARAMRHVEQGNTLARRGATATANGEFIQALVTVADGLDSVAGNNNHNQSLKKALQILDDVRDLYVDNTTAGSVADPAFIVGTHVCGVVSAEEAGKLTRTEILQRYLDGISHHFSAACGNDPIAASALSALGKLHAIRLNQSGTPAECEWNIAMTLFRTALICNPQDARSANEMGVLCVRVGNHATAKEMFQISLRIRQTTATWTNLAWLHNQLGEHEMAALAEQEAGLVAAEDGSRGTGLVRWIDPQAFGARPEEFDPASGPAANTQTADVRSEAGEKKSLFSNPFKR